MLPPSNTFPEPCGITVRFQIIYEKNEKPKGFCVFLSVDENGRTLYLSPVAKYLSGDLIRQLSDYYEVSNCDAPLRFTVERQVGDSKSCEDLLK